MTRTGATAECAADERELVAGGPTQGGGDRSQWEGFEHCCSQVLDMTPTSAGKHLRSFLLRAAGDEAEIPRDLCCWIPHHPALEPEKKR